MHQVYREIEDPDSDLSQGDIIDAVRLRPALKGHQDYMAQRADFKVFCVMTQSCDLVRTQKPAEYITLAVVRLVTNVFKKGGNVQSASAILKRIVDYQQNHYHYFYLPAEPKAGIKAASVVDLRVTFALHKKHYGEIIKARNIGMKTIFAANLGWMAGYVFSRIAMPEWDEKGMGETRDDHVTGLLESIETDAIVDPSELETTLDQDATQQVLNVLQNRVIQLLKDMDRKLDDLQRRPISQKMGVHLESK